MDLRDTILEAFHGLPPGGQGLVWVATAVIFALGMIRLSGAKRVVWAGAWGTFALWMIGLLGAVVTGLSDIIGSIVGAAGGA